MDEKKKLEEAKAARNAYRREWRRKNPEKDRAIQMRYWLNKAKKQKEGEGKENARNDD